MIAGLPANYFCQTINLVETSNFTVNVGEDDP